MGYYIGLTVCIGCETIFPFNPEKVPVLVIEGRREPICKTCFERWNKIHRTDKGLEPIVLDPSAYEYANENPWEGDIDYGNEIEQ